jgi:hypothetical protein
VEHGVHGPIDASDRPLYMPRGTDIACIGQHARQINSAKERQHPSTLLVVQPDLLHLRGVRIPLQ